MDEEQFDPANEDYDPQNEIDDMLNEGCQFRLIGLMLMFSLIFL